ncbi:MAG: alpha/beta hydrolase, partial [Alphaproteobacteria bacterium]|nr:alpha/beta hydrolase [Alphaproteobacteria bacterium]
HSMGNYLASNALAGLVNRVLLPVAMTAEYINERFKDLPEAEAQALEATIRNEISRAKDAKRQPPYLIDEYVMIAPDVERRHVTKSRDEQSNRAYIGPFYSGLEHIVGNVVNVYSRFDGALSISTIEKKPKDWALKVGDALAAMAPWGALDDLKRDPDNKWEMRLGSSAHPITAPANFASLNATEIAGRPIDHSDHIDSAPVAEAIASALGLVKN